MRKNNILLILEVIIVVNIPLLMILPSEIVHSQLQTTQSSRTPASFCESAGIPYGCGGGYYIGGDGDDEEALNFSNINLMRGKWGQMVGAPHEKFLSQQFDSPVRDVVIAIIDTGITRDMWYYIKAMTECEIEVYVNWYYDENDDPFLTLETTNPEDVDEAEDLEYDDRNSHGSQVAWIIAQAVNCAKLWILDIQGEEENPLFYTPVQGRIAALTWLENHTDSYSGLDIITMSYGGPNPDSTEETLLQKLKDKGIMLFAAAGNAEPMDDEDVLVYPRSFETVWGVGAHYDDADNYLTDGQYFTDPYCRVSKERCQDVRDEDDCWASQYKSNPQPGQSVEFVAPGFDYETRARDLTEIVVDRTSYACPHAAAIAAYAVATCNYAYTYTQSQIWDYTYEALKKAAEKSYVPDMVGTMQIKSAYPASPTADDKIGYGSIDAYDMVRYLLGGKIVPSSTSVSYGSHDGYPFYSKSTTKVDIYRTGDYILRVNYRINEGAWQTSNDTLTLSVGSHDVPTRWLASIGFGDTIEVWWEVLSPTTANTLNAEDTITSFTFPDAAVLPSSYIYRYDFPLPYKAKSRMYFDIDVSGNYRIVVRYKRYWWGPPPYGGAWDSSWITVYNYTDYYPVGTNYLLENYLGEFNWWITTLKCWWSIYDDQNNLISQYIKEG